MFRASSRSVSRTPARTDWSPSLGFAYSPGKDGVWAIRGGFNRAFDMPYGNLAANTAPAFYGSGMNVNINNEPLISWQTVA